MSDSANDPQENRRNTVAAMLGSAALLFAVMIVGLAIADSGGGTPLWLPRSWYTNRAMWYLLALAGFAAAWILLKQSSSDGESTQLRTAGSDVRFARAVLYTRSGCHLCDEMRQLLDRYARFFPAIEERDIDSDAALAERFTDCVPVLEIDGRIRFRGRVDEALLRRLIDATPPREKLASGEPANDRCEA